MRFVSEFEELAAIIAGERACSGRNPEEPFILAIDGRSGAGKSTLAARLAARFDTLVVCGDDFFAGGVTLRDDPAPVLAETCIDWRSLAGVLTGLLQTGKARFHPFDWERFDGSKEERLTEIEGKPVIIVEGVYSARPELRKFLDLSILAEVPDALRTARLIQREGEIGPWERQWHAAEDWYFETRAKREAFDLIYLPGTPGQEAAR